MEKKKAEKRNFLIFILFFLVILCGCQTNSFVSNNHELKIISFGIENSNSNYIVPGQSVKIFAKANKTKDISYSWKIAGVDIDSNSNLIEWTIPLEKGNYTISVTAKDIKTNETVVYDEELIVSENHAELAVEDFKTKIKINTTTVSKELTDESESTIEIESVDNVMNITITDENGTSQFIVENGDIYEVEKTKKNSLFSQISLNKKLILSNILPVFKQSKTVSYDSILQLLTNQFGNPVILSENKYKFTKTEGKSSITIVVDDKINRITEMKIIDGTFKTITGMRFTYLMENGHINLKKVESAEASVYPDVTDMYYTVMEFENIY